MEILRYLFGFRGRSPRSEFAARLGAVLACFVMAFAAVYLNIFKVPVVLISALTALGIWLTATVARLHDRNKSAWYVLIFFGLPTLIANFEAPSRDNYNFYLSAFGIKFSVAYLGAGSFLSLLSSAVFVWMVAELGFLKGDTGPNRYGPDPFQPGTPTSPT